MTQNFVVASHQFKLFSDINECTTMKPCKCASSLGGCKADCQNYPGSYKCSCGNGFQLMFDRKTCVGKTNSVIFTKKKCL